MKTRDTMRGSRHVQCEVVAGAFGELVYLTRFTHDGRSGQPDTVRDSDSVGEIRHPRLTRGIESPGDIGRHAHVVFPPDIPRLHNAMLRIANVAASGEPMIRSPFLGSPSAASTALPAKASTSSISAVSSLAASAWNASAIVSVGSPTESRSCRVRMQVATPRDVALGCTARPPRLPYRRLATACPRRPRRVRAVRRSRGLHHCLRHARRCRTTAFEALFASPSVPDRRQAVGRRPRRALRQLVCAAVMLRLVDHVPARMCHANAACRSPAASRCSAIKAAFSSTASGRRVSMRPASRR